MSPRWTRHALLAAALVALTIAPALGASVPVQVSATVLSANNCRFRTAAVALPFGNLLGGATVDALATATIQMRCLGPTNPATFAITDDDGLYETGPGLNRMRHATDPTAYLPYQFSYAPSTATIPRNTWINISITGRVLAGNINTALSGSYSDTVTLTLLP